MPLDNVVERGYVLIDELAADSTLSFVSKAKSLAPRILANLGLGEPDKNPPRELVEELVKATKEKPTYTPSGGLPSLRKKLAEWFSERYNTEISYREVMVTPSGKAALYLSLLYFSKGEAVLTDPTYYSYEPVLKSVGVPIKKVPLLRKDYGYSFPENVESLVTDRGISVLNAPSNPTGSILGDDIFDLVERAREKRAHVVSDEPYDVFVYEGRHVSFLSTPHWREVGAFVYSFSKILCIPGWRLGAIVAKEEAIRKLIAAASNVYGCPCKWEQMALERVLEHPDVINKHVNEMVSEYAERRGELIEELRKIAEFPGVGEGSFYAFPDFGVDAEELALRAAKEGVIVVPGSVFSEKYGRTSLRISFSAPRSELKYGLEVLGRLVTELKGNAPQVKQR